MTTSQLSSALPGLTFNSWITLETFCKGIVVEPDYKLFINPKAVQFYFDDSNNLLFVRYTSVIEDNFFKRFTSKDAEIHIIAEDKDYSVSFSDGGIDDPIIGKYHIVFDIDKIIFTF